MSDGKVVLSGNFENHVRKRSKTLQKVNKIIKEGNEKPPMEKDTPLMAPINEWDKQDRRPASQDPTSYFFMKGLDKVDWSR